MNLSDFRKTIGFVVVVLIGFVSKVQAQEAHNPIFLSVTGNKIFVSVPGKKLVQINAIAFNFTEPESVTLTDSNKTTYQIRMLYPASAQYRNHGKPLVVNLTVTKLAGGLHFSADPRWSRNVTVHLADYDEHYFGVLEHLYPNNRKSPDLRGDVVDVDVLGTGDQYHENYSSVWSAFYMSSRGYASFFDTFAEGKYRFATGKNNETQLYHHTGKLNWYILSGSNGDQELQQR